MLPIRLSIALLIVSIFLPVPSISHAESLESFRIPELSETSSPQTMLRLKKKLDHYTPKNYGFLREVGFRERTPIESVELISMITSTLEFEDFYDLYFACCGLEEELKSAVVLKSIQKHPKADLIKKTLQTKGWSSEGQALVLATLNQDLEGVKESFESLASHPPLKRETLLNLAGILSLQLSSDEIFDFLWTDPKGPRMMELYSRGQKKHDPYSPSIELLSALALESGNMERAKIFLMNSSIFDMKARRIALQSKDQILIDAVVEHARSCTTRAESVLTNCFLLDKPKWPVQLGKDPYRTPVHLTHTVGDLKCNITHAKGDIPIVFLSYKNSSGNNASSSADFPTHIHLPIFVSKESGDIDDTQAAISDCLKFKKQLEAALAPHSNGTEVYLHYAEGGALSASKVPSFDVFRSFRRASDFGPFYPFAEDSLDTDSSEALGAQLSRKSIPALRKHIVGSNAKK